MLIAVIQSTARYLWKLTCAIEPSAVERVARTGVDGPICRGRVVTRWIETFAIIEKTLVVAVPGVGFAWEDVRCVRGAFVVAVNL